MSRRLIITVCDDRDCQAIDTCWSCQNVSEYADRSTTPSKFENLDSSGTVVYIQGIQEIQNQMVLGLRNNPVDPYIIKKV
jgi:hypothetical protein